MGGVTVDTNYTESLASQTTDFRDSIVTMFMMMIVAVHVLRIARKAFNCIVPVFVEWVTGICAHLNPRILVLSHLTIRQ